MRYQPPFSVAAPALLRFPSLFTLGFALALLVAPTLAGDAPRPADAVLEECSRKDGTLTRYLLCLDVHARRPADTHATFFQELDALDEAMLRRLPRKPAQKSSLDVLGRLYHADRRRTDYETAVTLVDVLERRREDERAVLAADCDIFCFLNAGIAEKYYGGGSPGARGVGIVRPRYNHLTNVALEGGRITGILETVDGSLRRVPRGRVTDALREQLPTLPLMSEDEIVALYLANIGLALQVEGRHSIARTYFDAALRLNGEEFVAHVGRSMVLILEAAERDRDAGATLASCSASTGGLLEQAESSALAAMTLEPEAEGPYSLLGRIKLRSCAPARAQRFLETALAIHPDPINHYYLTLALESQQKFEEAIQVARRGKKLLRNNREPRYRALRSEMDYLLALAHTYRAESLRSERDLRKAMDYLSSVAAVRSNDEALRRMQTWIDRVDREIGPVRRDFGFPRRAPRSMDASLGE